MFKRGLDPRAAMGTGIMASCHSLIKEMDGIILNESQSWQNKKFRTDPDLWTNPKTGKKYNNAGEFEWLEPFLLNKIAGHSIVIEIHGDQFYICKNLYYWCTVGYSGDIRDLYRVILCWYEKKRKFRRRTMYVNLNGKDQVIKMLNVNKPI